ncbi:MAG: hypothetical protein WC596_03290 [Candidatus Shapirobacteria bacterium]
MLNSERKGESSHGEKVHRSRVLAAARRESSFDEERWSVEEVEKARKRLMSVEAMLSPVSEANMTPFQKASLEIEKIWLRFKTGKISGSERQSNLGRTLNYWETNNHEVFDQLTQENGDGITLLAGIRNRVIPPINIGGFHTKRR